MNKFKCLGISGIAVAALFLGACDQPGDDDPVAPNPPVSVSPTVSVSPSVEPSVSVSPSKSIKVSVSPSTASCAPSDDDCSEDLDATDQPRDGN